MTCPWRSLLRQFLTALFLGGFSATCFATHTESAAQSQQQLLNKARQSQNTVEKLDDQTQSMLSEFRAASLELENLKIYHDQLEKIVASQEQEKAELARQMQEIDVTQRNIMPLMLRMLKVLDEFVELDAPFLEKERRMRISELHQLLDRSDVDLAEKYHRLIEAYMVETDYGRTIEAYKGDLDLDGKKRTVEFLRFGRLGFYYLTLDNSQAGYWDRDKKDWQVLPDAYRSAISQGLKIAQKQAAPDLLKLPVAAPEAVQ